MLRPSSARRAVTLVACLFASTLSATPPHPGYYRAPSVHGETIVFTSEGDLWTVSLRGGEARRLTTGTGTETLPRISPDGKTVAYYADYEGPGDVYTIPIDGGLPQRKTWDGSASPLGWTPSGQLIVSTQRYSTLPDPQIVLVGANGERTPLPLATGAEAAYSADGKTLVYTRFDRQWSETKRYKGGWAETLWRYDGQGEAVPLTADYPGNSHNPMISGGRVYFLSDRDGIQNVWSMNPEGRDLKQVTHQHPFDIESASIDGGTLVYACGADLWSLNLKTGREAIIPITLVSDFDQLREHWVKKPANYMTTSTSRRTVPAPSSPRADRSSPSPPSPVASSRSPANPMSVSAARASCPTANRSSRSQPSPERPSSGSFPQTD